MIVEHQPVAGPPSSARIRAAISRICRAHARAGDALGEIFGDTSGASSALERRVQRTVDAEETTELRARAAELHLLVTWVSAVCEAIELETDAAADVQAHLATMIAECELIACAPPSAA